MNKSESIKELAIDLTKAQSELENAQKKSVNPYFHSKYADLAEIINTAKDVLAKHGFSVVQMPAMEGDYVTVETLLLHTSGEWISNIASAPLDNKKRDAQGVGSAITYLRRYSLAAFLGIAQEDDDGNSATTKVPEKKAKPFDIEAAVEELTSQTTLEGLQAAYKNLYKQTQTEKDRYMLTDVKDDLKSEMQAFVAEN